jgi:alcohol dehydrogenase class IV/GTP:adenosylcobinamide-phosphate guanylyltransferase
MKAVILNSGIGKRMGELTKNNHKAMVQLSNGEAVFLRQLRILMECGIKEFVITTGPYREKIEAAANQMNRDNQVSFTFIHNPFYDKTNYIYSMYLTEQYLNDDILLMHGDLVFTKKLVEDMLKDSRENIAAVNKEKVLPQKDFKAKLKDNKIQKIGIEIFDADCYAFQPFYKLSKEYIIKWLGRISGFIASGMNQVYAENALNEILPSLNIEAFDYENYYIDEIDTPQDLKRVSEEIRQYDFDAQMIFEGEDDYLQIETILRENNARKIMLVCGRSYDKQYLKDYIASLKVEIIRFSDFSSNPVYEDVAKGVELFNKNQCDFIVSIGGGSAIDTAKNIKLFSCLDNSRNYLKQAYKFCPIKHLAVPTTAGTGSECTRFSVLYYEGEKQSISHDSIIPEYVILDPRLLTKLPDYQKKSTMLDALCQAIEAFWSVNSTKISRQYSKESIQFILKNIDKALLNDLDALKNMQRASFLSGKAINIAQTTAAHAMSYKLSSLYNISHGHAVSLSLPHIWMYMVRNLDKCTDKRGRDYLKNIFAELNDMFYAMNSNECIGKFIQLYKKLNLPSPKLKNKDELIELVNSVNPVRLKNNPVMLDKNIIEDIYKHILAD